MFDDLGHQFGGDLERGSDQIALVLALSIVHDHDTFPIAKALERLLDRVWLKAASGIVVRRLWHWLDRIGCSGNRVLLGVRPPLDFLGIAVSICCSPAGILNVSCGGLWAGLHCRQLRRSCRLSRTGGLQSLLLAQQGFGGASSSQFWFDRDSIGRSEGEFRPRTRLLYAVRSSQGLELGSNTLYVYQHRSFERTR
jgi:hypothetical protein